MWFAERLWRQISRVVLGGRKEAERARDEEATASRLQAEARLTRERGQHELADQLDAAAVEHGRRAREARENEWRDRARDLAGEQPSGPVEKLQATLAREREVSGMLQRSLLPEALPLMTGVRLAAAFRPADDLVGGDWYDAFRLPGERLAFALGDVVGHGLEAATAAVELRTSLRTHALQDPDPGFVASRLNDLASVRELLSYSSLVYGVVDPSGGRLDVVNLGHPPLLLRRANGGVEAIPADHGLLTVKPAGTELRGAAHELAPGDVLLAYTDGLIERRRGNDEERVAQLAAILVADPDPEDVVTTAVDTLAGRPADDDIAVLCLALAEPD